MAYITYTLNHMRAVKAWTDANAATANLDLANWELEVRCRNRYFRLHPRFRGRNAGRVFYTHELGEHAVGFIGWLPYRQVRYDLSDDKLVFKSFAAGAGLRVPARWPAEAPEADYILKRSVGSFGYEIAGPYRAGDAAAYKPAGQRGPEGPLGEVFAEQFIAGDAVKVWFWGDRAFFAHRQRWPRVDGDGRTTLRALIAERAGCAPDAVERLPEVRVLQDALAYQGVNLFTVLEQGQSAWLDFRYDQTYTADKFNAHSDSQLEELPASARADIDRIGAVLAQELQQRFSAPVLFAVDGVLDEKGSMWWLEVNSNPVLPPDGYAQIFTTLFGAQRS